jgi:hypothetical protein
LLDGRKFAQSGHPANMLKKENWNKFKNSSDADAQYGNTKDRMTSSKKMAPRFNVDIQINDHKNVDKMTENVDFVCISSVSDPAWQHPAGFR